MNLREVDPWRDAEPYDADALDRILGDDRPGYDTLRLLATIHEMRERRCKTCAYWRDEVCVNDGPLCAEFTPNGFGCIGWKVTP